MKSGTIRGEAIGGREDYCISNIFSNKFDSIINKPVNVLKIDPLQTMQNFELLGLCHSILSLHSVTVLVDVYNNK